MAQQPRPILPHAQSAGPMPWIVAMMTFLAVCGAALAIALTPAAASLSGQIAGRVTIQIVENDPLVRREAVRAVRDALRDAPYVSQIVAVPESELETMAQQWLGDGLRSADIPLPALVDVDLVGGGSAATLARLREAVRTASPAARVVPHSEWLGPVAGLMRTVGWIAAVVALFLLVTAASVAILTVRALLATQQMTIDVLHLVGATDVQIARLFQRQVARSISFGALAGGLIAFLALGAVAWQVRDVQAGLVGGGVGLRYILLVFVPPLIVASAVFAARIYVLRALRAAP